MCPVYELVRWYEMNVYDFDKTIYSGDSSINFYLFCAKKKPILFTYLVLHIWWMIIYKARLCSKEKLKEKYFGFVLKIDVDKMIKEFWDHHIKKIKPWYLNQKRCDDVIISASPDFLVRPCLERIGITNCICSSLSLPNVKFEGKNCYGEEKVNRFRKIFSNRAISNFYSDSLSDEPLASISDNAYIVQENNIIPWNTYKRKTKKSK